MSNNISQTATQTATLALRTEELLVYHCLDQLVLFLLLGGVSILKVWFSEIKLRVMFILESGGFEKMRI